MELTHIINKINKTTLILSAILLLILAFFGFLINRDIYWPNQTKVQEFSSSLSILPYVITDDEYKDIEVKLIDNTGKTLTYDPYRKFEPSVDGYSAPRGFLYTHFKKIPSLELDKFKIEITNNSNKIRFISYGVWHETPYWTKKHLKRLYF